MTDIQKAIATLNDCDEYSLRHHSGEIQTVIEGYDAAQSELAALREELAKSKEQLEHWHYLDLQRDSRLTAAEQRNADLIELLRQTSHLACERMDLTLEFSLKDALKPTKSGASE